MATTDFEIRILDKDRKHVSSLSLAFRSGKKSQRQREEFVAKYANLAGALLVCSCACVPLRLVSRSSGTRLFRRPPGTYSLHDLACPLHLPPAGSAGAPSLPGYKPDPNGGAFVKLDASLLAVLTGKSEQDILPRSGRRQRDPNTNEPSAVADKHPEIARPDEEQQPRRGQRSAIRLGGLFRILMENGAWHRWVPGHGRKEEDLVRTVEQQAKQITLDAALWDLETVFLKRDELTNRNLADNLCRIAGQTVVHRLLVAEFEQADTDPTLFSGSGGYLVKLRRFALAIHCRAAVFDAADAHFAMRSTNRGDTKVPDLAGIRRTNRIVVSPNRRIWFLMLLRCDGRTGEVEISRIAPQLFSMSLVPVDSGFEADFAEFLLRIGRSFRKPLRFTRDQQKLPDFVLEDCNPNAWIEVWGMNTAAYRNYREEKRTWATKNKKQLHGCNMPDERNFREDPNHIFTVEPPLPPATVCSG